MPHPGEYVVNSFPGYNLMALAGVWVNSPGGAPASYYIDQLGIVHLAGLVAGGALLSTIFTMPAGYRPQYREVFSVVGNNAFARVDVNTDGQIFFMVGNSAFLQLSGITYKAYQ